MRRKLVVGNWKMHGGLAANQMLLEGLVSGLGKGSSAEVAVCAPFPYLFQLRDCLGDTPIKWGAQNLSQHKQGAYTGEVSGAMIREFGCHYVIVGHSERRSLYGENDTLVAAKFIAAQEIGLVPILCVGETLSQREAGATEHVVVAQLDAVLGALTESAGISALKDAVVAYEPVWAIGTGHTATPLQAQEVHAMIRARIARHDPGIAATLPILYGGSVKPQNAQELFTMTDIDGGLIGGASLTASDFLAIVTAA